MKGASPAHKFTALLITTDEFLSDMEICHFILRLSESKVYQSRSGDQRRKRIWGAAISMWGSTFLKASDQSSTAPSPGHSSTHSREENKPVRVLGSDTATLGAIEMKSGTASSPSK